MHFNLVSLFVFALIGLHVRDFTLCSICLLIGCCIFPVGFCFLCSSAYFTVVFEFSSFFIIFIACSFNSYYFCFCFLLSFYLSSFYFCCSSYCSHLLLFFVLKLSGFSSIAVCLQKLYFCFFVFLPPASFVCS